jgi:hypothetical protein
MKVSSKCAQWLGGGALLLMALGGQAQITSSLPRDQYGALIAPDPTPEQRELGKQLLDKVLDVVLTIPLSEPEKVFLAIGFKNSSRSVHPTNEFNASSGQAQGVAAVGLTSASIMKLTNLPPESKQSPYGFTTNINFGLVCIHVDDVWVRLKPLAKEVVTRDRVRIHPYPLAPRQKMDVLSFLNLNHLTGRVSTLSLSFDYQYCANTITVNYAPTTQEEQP